MKKAFAVAMLFTVLSVSVCVGEDVPDGHCNFVRNAANYYGWGLPAKDLAKAHLNGILQDKASLKHKDELSRSLNYDYSSIWLMKDNPHGEDTYRNRPLKGAIGTNYQRIDIYIGKVTKSNYNADIYLVTGKSKVNKNVCDFSGEIKLIKLFYSADCSDGIDVEQYFLKHGTRVKCAELFAEYVFYEDSSQSHSGVFRGIFQADVHTHKTNMLLNDSRYDADDYSNRAFIGTWTDYKTKTPKHCMWGDQIYPSGLIYGDGDVIICPQFLKYGWGPSEDDSERKSNWWQKK